ncbi:hypothetical protein BH23CHL4_BH23CHL4_17900 [soil metagenome]
MLSGYDGLQPFYGDLHSHCSISYGHGPLEDAYRNARAQLDFVSVTAHAHWPDLPEADERLAPVNAYHKEGFRRALEQWPHYRDVTNSVNQEGEFVSLLSFEWHSMQSGDHNIYYRGNEGEIIPAKDLAEMRAELRRLWASGQSSLLIPHHIGYRQGYRGINWAEFTGELSPVVEIFSMHGASDSVDAPYPYLHTMGPRDGRSTMQHGLALGNLFGVIGSTDHHSAHPGSYGHGRLGLWGRELSREGIWDAIASRRTWALTGDNIELGFSINNQPMGSVLPATSDRAIEVSVIGGSAIDYIDVLHNNRVIHKLSPIQEPWLDGQLNVKVLLELGWGELDEDVDWKVDLQVSAGALKSIEPRFRGRDIVSPQDLLTGDFAYSSWKEPDHNRVTFATRTWKNPTIVSPATQGICLEIEGDGRTEILGTINDLPVAYSLNELLTGSRTGYLGGFLTPAYCFHRAIPEAEYAAHTSFVHRGRDAGRDWYYVRVRQLNDQWAWSSPIWVGNP